MMAEGGGWSVHTRCAIIGQFTKKVIFLERGSEIKRTRVSNERTAVDVNDDELN